MFLGQFDQFVEVGVRAIVIKIAARMAVKHELSHLRELFLIGLFLVAASLLESEVVEMNSQLVA